MLFRSVTISVERMSKAGFVMYKARNRGSSRLSQRRVAFWLIQVRPERFFSFFVLSLRMVGGGDQSPGLPGTAMVGVVASIQL